MRRFAPTIAAQALIDAQEQIGDFGIDANHPMVRAALERYYQNTHRIAQTTRDDLRALAEQAAAENWGNRRLRDAVRDMKQQAAARATRIARTESATAYTQSSLATYQASGVVSSVEWLLGPDACPLCEEIVSSTPIVKLGEAFHDGAMVPAHPNCRCAISPVL